MQSEFFGYDALCGKSRVVALLDEDALPVDALPSGSRGYVVTGRTPFYGASGGQTGDTGLLEFPGGRAEVVDTIRPLQKIIAHHVEVKEGEILPEQEVSLTVQEGARMAAARNHTCTHLLHARCAGCWALMCIRPALWSRRIVCVSTSPILRR